MFALELFMPIVVFESEFEPIIYEVAGEFIILTLDAIEAAATAFDRLSTVLDKSITSPETVVTFELVAPI